MSIGEMTVVDYELMQDKISTPTAPLKKKEQPTSLDERRVVLFVHWFGRFTISWVGGL